MLGANAFGQISQNAISRSNEWVVRGVFGQESSNPGYERSWDWAFGLRPSGDLDDDGTIDLFPRWNDQEVTGTAPRDGMLLATRGLHERVTVIDQPYQEWLSMASTLPMLYQAPSELLMHATGTALHGLLGGHAFRLTGTMVASDVDWFWNWTRGFDADNDGFEELFSETTGPNGTVLNLCLDGRSLLPKWSYSHFLPNGFVSYSALTDPLGWPDLNGDHSPDYLARWLAWNPSIQSHVFSLSALDGSTGALIWKIMKPGIGSRTASISWGPDVTGDGIADIALCDPIDLNFSGGFSGLIALISGADGSVVWERTFASLAPVLILPGHRAEHLVGLTGFSRPFHGYGPVELLLGVNFADLQSTAGMGQQRTVMLDARTGSFVTVADEPMSSAPWYPDTYGIWPVDFSGSRTILGDVDRDGFNEVATSAELWSLDDPQIFGVPTALLILGRKTLFMPDEAQPGDEVEVRVHIPSAPDHDFLLLLSQGFEGEGGKKVDGWRTFLKPDALLQTTLAGRYPGRLAANGRGTLTIRLPNNPGLSGATLYSKAVIFKPGSTTEVWTLTSLGITHIL